MFSFYEFSKRVHEEGLGGGFGRGVEEVGSGCCFEVGFTLEQWERRSHTLEQ